MADARRRRKKGSRVRRHRGYDDSDGEVIDIGVPDGGTSSEDSNSQRTAAAGSRSPPNTLAPPAASTLPDSQTGSNPSHSRQAAHDINHFFQRGDKANPQSFTVCIKCK
jgi:hypothetical protein